MFLMCKEAAPKSVVSVVKPVFYLLKSKNAATNSTYFAFKPQNDWLIAAHV